MDGHGIWGAYLQHAGSLNFCLLQVLQAVAEVSVVVLVVEAEVEDEGVLAGVVQEAAGEEDEAADGVVL